MASKLNLLTLPLEIRQNIYTAVVATENNRKQLEDDRSCFEFDLRLYLVCKQIYHEAREVFWRHNVFVCVETPFADAQQNTEEIGRTPLVAKGEHVDAFSASQLHCMIEAPEMIIRGEGSRFVIAVEDIEKFCTMWYYLDLTYYDRYRGGLNGRLCLTLTLALNPHNEQTRQLSKSIQESLLLPWGCIKSLQNFRVHGPHDYDIEDVVRSNMATSYESPGYCIEKGTRLKDEGNQALKSGNNKLALELYFASFHAIHIVVAGRRRDVWADGFFDTHISEGQFKGQHASLLRTNLRVRLVANIILAFLNLEQYDEAYFWGMRTISIMRNMFSEAADRPRNGPGFLPQDVWGRIYYRTALAAKGMGDMSGAREFLRIAKEWLPANLTVMKDLAEWGSIKIG